MNDITEFDVFFLSYYEPNAEKHWSDLLEKCPWAQRVNGVKGFDAAHRACAEQSSTDWFITVDADNIVSSSFFDQKVELDPNRPNQCFSWNAVNQINGLIYGNGGLKLWSKNFVLNMNSHENADDPRKAIDFCWEEDYSQVHKTFSEVYNNGSPYQAFRVGFREGIKLSLDRGERVSPEMLKKDLHPINLRNLKIWATVGRDIENGIWAIYGARLGLASILDNSFDYTVIRDYDWFNSFWSDIEQKFKSDDGLLKEIEHLGNTIESKTKINLPMLDNKASEFFREAFKLRND